MDYETYKLIHFAGIFTLFFAFGSLFKGDKTTKGAVIGHGIGLLLILLGGFGMQAKMKDVYQAVYGSGFPTWRKIIKGLAAWIIIIALGMASAYLALKKPAMGNKPTAAAVE
jgi:hypothetical protein